MLLWLHWTAFVIYLAAAAVPAVSFVRGGRPVSRLATGTLLAGVLVHAAALAMFVLRWGELPLVGLGPVLSTLALLTGVAALAAASLGHAGTVGLVLNPLVAVLAGAAGFMGVRPGGEAPAFGGLWFVLHVVFASMGYVGLIVAFAAGLMYLLQFRELKSKHFGAVFRFFPPLDTLDRLGRSGLLLGFPFLSLSLLLGWAWTARFQRTLAPGNPQVIWGVLTWLVFAAALWARSGGGHRGHRGAVASVVGFAVVVLAYVVLRVGAGRAGGFL